MYEINNRAVQLSKDGKLDDAIELFKLALIEDPNDTNLNFNIALVYMKKEDFKTAVIYLEKSIEFFANDDNLRELGVCYIKLEDFDKAKGPLVRAITDFGSSDSENVMGVYCFQTSQFQKAQKHFENAVKLNSKNRDAWFNLKDTYLELEMEREAKMALHNFNQLDK